MDTLSEFYRLLTREFEARRDLLSALVSHKAAIGAYRETILSQLLDEHFGNRCRVTSGFFLSPDRSSQQHDILLIDGASAEVTFYRGAIAVVSPSATLVAIETKSKLDTDSVSDMFEKANDAKSRNKAILTIGFALDFSPARVVETRLKSALSNLQRRRWQHVPDVICAGTHTIAVAEHERILTVYAAPEQSAVESLCRAVSRALFADHRSDIVDRSRPHDGIKKYAFRA